MDYFGETGAVVDVGGAQSIERASTLLRAVGQRTEGGASLTELVAVSGLKQPTVRRLLLALMRAGLVEQDPVTRGYFLGAETYALGLLAAARFSLHHLARDSLARLARQTEDTAFLTVRRGDYGTCLHREEGTYPIRSHVLHAGDRHPLGVGAGNIAMLAKLSVQEADAIIAAHAPTWIAQYPRLAAEIVAEVVEETRQRGFSVNRGLNFPGSWGIGVAITDAQGAPIAALSIATIAGRLEQERQIELAGLLHAEARTIEAAMAAQTANAAVRIKRVKGRTS